MKSALFVDFDNLFSQLRQLQPEVAERFARHPSAWIDWLVKSLELPQPHEAGAMRRLLVRRCYLNPNWYQTYRHAFLRAGFEIVDCPPVTSQGKTSTDIHMVLDIVDLLQHETRCDEFIVFSADADFTPVLRKLRRHDRRTTVLAFGFPSAAYQASADLMIDERIFVRDALGFGRTNAEAAHEVTETDSVRVEAPRPAAAEPRSDRSPKTPQQAEATPRARRSASAEELFDISKWIWTEVDAAAAPVSASSISLRLKQQYPEVMENWNGLGNFKAFFRSLGLSRILWLSGSGGRLADPVRHELDGPLPEQDPESPWHGAEEAFPLVREICLLTGAPMLAPKDPHRVLAALEEVLRTEEFKLAVTVASVVHRCLDTSSLRVRPRDVNFLIRGMQMNGQRFGQDAADMSTLVERIRNQVLFLCEREQKVLSHAELDQMQHWISGGRALASTDYPCA